MSKYEQQSKSFYGNLRKDIKKHKFCYVNRAAIKGLSKYKDIVVEYDADEELYIAKFVEQPKENSTLEKEILKQVYESQRT